MIGPLPGSTNTAAATRGIASVLGEVGGRGQWPESDVSVHAAGLRRALVAAGVLPPSAATGPAGRMSKLLTKEAWLRSDVGGYWHPVVDVGDEVAAGAHLGEVRDAFGSVPVVGRGADRRGRPLPRHVAGDERGRSAPRHRSRVTG